MNEFDIIIIGGGPGGYHAALLAGEQGHKVLLVEKEAIGGTCLNWGCIPTKMLLALAKQYGYSQELHEMGLDMTPNYRHDTAMQWKSKVIHTLKTGIRAQLKKSKVTILEKEAEIQEVSPEKKVISIVGDEHTHYTAPYMIIASGVQNSIPPIPGIEHSGYVTSRELLDLDTLPDTLVIIGGGVIGVEFATVFSQFGTQVTIIEMLPHILDTMEEESIKVLSTVLEAQGVVIHSNAKIKQVTDHSVEFVNAEGKESTASFDVLLVSTGRNVALDYFQALNIHTSGKGIAVDEYMQTNIPKLYAIGDVAGSYQLAHVAYRMAEVAVGHISSSSNASQMNYTVIPSVVYTNPECASCGYTEKRAIAEGRQVVSASLPVSFSGRVVAEHGALYKGFCKIIADAHSHKILGIHIISPMASEIISSASVILATELRVEELVDIVFPHPSVSELIHNVALVLHSKIKS